MTTEALSLAQALKLHFGFDKFKGNQEAIMQSLLSGRDTFVIMPTGGGKSLCYQLPALMSDGTAIVISPLIALMKNQVDSMRNFSENDSIAHFLNSSLAKSAIDQVKSDIVAGQTKLLYVAPESLTKEENIEFLKTVRISFYAVDEAHCISEWGHDFRPEYRRIRPIINEIGTRPVIALTATATPKVQHDIQKNLAMNDAMVFKSSFNRENLYYEIRLKTPNTDRDIIRFIKQRPGKSGIIYCLSRKKVEELAELLRVNNIRALPYHAGMDPATRSANQDAFLMEQVDVIVATIAFGMGIDKPDVRVVIHYDVPPGIEEYYQEAGRAGRDGRPSYAVLLTSPTDAALLRRRVTQEFPDREVIRQIYEHVCNFLSISLYEGYESVHEFDIMRFCQVFRHELRQCHAALRILEQAGYMQYIEDSDRRAKAMITVSREELYHLQGASHVAETLLKRMLRDYTGLFMDYQPISEHNLAAELQITPDQVYDALLELGRMKIVSYIPRSNVPVIYLPTRREEPKHLVIGRDIYEDRRERLSRRAEAMIDYATSAHGCREHKLLEYFGEHRDDTCGRCDLCRNRRNRHDRHDRHDRSKAPKNRDESIISDVMSFLKERPYGADFRILEHSLRVPSDALARVLAFLCSENYLILDNYSYRLPDSK